MYYVDLASSLARIPADQLVDSQIKQIITLQGGYHEYTTVDMQGDIRYILLILNKLLPDLVYDVTTLERINVTIPEIVTLIEGITVGGHRVSDIDSTNNIIRAYKYISQLIKRGDVINSESLYKTLHTLLSVNLVDHPGSYRPSNVRIGGANNWICLSPVKIHGYVQEILAEFESSSQSVFDIMRLFCQLVYLQPFEDCNKRTARVFANYLLISRGLGIFSVHHTLIPEFNSYLVEAFDTADLNKLIDFLVTKCIMRFDGNEIVKDFDRVKQRTSFFSQQ